ncbi:cell division protein FtsQ/DivIB [Rhodocytophaga aerolata]|uniref:cell division protein FtsQ/DivIB n=1 Tax=Rhodocytophaga aerolata TaxID=455078 RepID=UPI0036152485
MLTKISNFFKYKLKRKVKVFLTFVIFFGLIGFVEKKQASKVCTKVNVSIENTLNNYFINETDVLALITNNGSDQLVGEEYKNIDLKSLEKRIKTNKFIRNCQVSRDLKGELSVEVKQRRPIARIVQRYGPDAYISDQGEVLPLSDRFTARVIIIEADNAENLVEKDLLQTDSGKNIFQLLQFIDSSRFWKAQIAQLYMNADGTILLYPQVGKQVIEFGTATDIERKFNKLKIFYKQIVPVKGWNRYSRVSLAYQNQIICE